MSALLLVLSAHAAAQKRTPSDAEFQDAMDFARANPKLQYGLNLPEGIFVPAAERMRVSVYTPLAWVYKASAERALKSQTMTLADVGPDERESVLRVFAQPYVPGEINSGRSVDHVVIMDKSRKRTLQPTWSESTPREVGNALGGKQTYRGVSAKFDLAALRELRGGDNQEFWIVLIEGKRETRYEVTRQLLQRLP